MSLLHATGNKQSRIERNYPINIAYPLAINQWQTGAFTRAREKNPPVFGVAEGGTAEKGGI